MEAFKGFKTILIGGALAVVPALTDYIAGVDWSFLGAQGGMFVGGVLMVIMRMLTTTPVGKAD